MRMRVRGRVGMRKTLYFNPKLVSGREKPWEVFGWIYAFSQINERNILQVYCVWKHAMKAGAADPGRKCVPQPTGPPLALMALDGVYLYRSSHRAFNSINYKVNSTANPPWNFLDQCLKQWKDQKFRAIIKVLTVMAKKWVNTTGEYLVLNTDFPAISSRVED